MLCNCKPPLAFKLGSLSPFKVFPATENATFFQPRTFPSHAASSTKKIPQPNIIIILDLQSLPEAVSSFSRFDKGRKNEGCKNKSQGLDIYSCKRNYRERERETRRRWSTQRVAPAATLIHVSEVMYWVRLWAKETSPSSSLHVALKPETMWPSKFSTSTRFSPTNPRTSCRRFFSFHSSSPCSSLLSMN